VFKRPTNGPGGRPSRRAFAPRSGDAACCLRGSSCCRCWKRALGRPREQVSRDIELRTAQHIFDVLGELKAAPRNLANTAVFESVLPHEMATHIGSTGKPAGSRSPDVAVAVRQCCATTWEKTGIELPRVRRSSRRRGVDRTGAQGVWHDGRTVAVKVQYPECGKRWSPISRSSAGYRCSPRSSFGRRHQGHGRRDLRQDPGGARLRTWAANQATFATAYETTRFRCPPSDCPARRRSGDRVARRDSARQAHQDGIQPERDRVGILIMRFNLSGPLRCGLLYAIPIAGHSAFPDGRPV